MDVSRKQAARGNRMKLTEGRKDHKKPFTKRGSYLSVVELPHTGVFTLGKIKAEFFPGLTHG
jgi:hypothetical protein